MGKIIAKKGRTFNWEFSGEELEHGAKFGIKVRVSYDGQKSGKARYSYTIINIFLVSDCYLRMKCSNILCFSAVKHLKWFDFCKMSWQHANRWRQNEKYPIAEGEFLISAGASKKESLFKEEMWRLRTLLPCTSEVIAACKQILSRYFAAQDRQVLDAASEYKWTNRMIRQSFLREELYEGDHSLYFDEVFGKGNWQYPTITTLHVVTFGFDPYPYVVFTSSVGTRVLAKIDGKFYEGPLNVSLSAPEDQIEIAVMLVMTNALGESNETVKVEAQASH